jgi:hypothetical protein
VPYSALRDKKTELIRKARDGSVFIAPTSATAITTLTTGAGADLTPLPTGYVDLGWISSDGASYARETEVSEVTSFGSVEPTRSDTTSDTITLSVTAQETKLETLALYTGADIGGIEANITTGEVQIAKPARPGFRHYRLFGLFVDDGDDGEIYIARFMPRARVTEIGEQAFTDGDDPISYPVTFTGIEDSALGYSHKWYFGGPGWQSLLESMNIPDASA